MLRRLQDYFPKWLAAFLVGLLALLIAGGGLYMPSQVGLKGQKKVLARVNGVKIRRGALDMAYEAFKQQQAQMGREAPITPEVQSELRSHILKQLINQEILKQYAYSNGYRIHPRTILSSIQKAPGLQVDGKFSPRRFAELLSAIGHTKTTFLKEMGYDHLMKQLQAAVMQSAFLLPQEMNQCVRLLCQERDFSYLELTAEQFVKSMTDLPEEALRAYYDRALTEFRVPEKVSVDYVVVSYQSIYKALKAVYPHDDTDTVKEKAAEQFKAAVDRLTQLSSKHPHSLSEAAEAFQVSIQSTPLMAREGAPGEVTTHPDVIRAAFSQAVLQGHNSPVLHLDAERVMLLRLKQHEPLRLREFDEVKEKVKEKLRLEQAKESAQAYGKALVEKLQQEVTPSLPANSKWRKVEKVRQDSETVPMPIVSAAFSIPYQDKALRVKGMRLPNGNYLVIRLTKVRQGKVGQLEEEQRERYQEELKQVTGQFDYIQYMQANEKRSKIDYTFN